MKTVPLTDIFITFSKIGAFTIGGGYMMVPAIQNEISKKGWINDEELPDIVALSQSVPGLLTVNMSIFTGYRIRGLKGSIVATLGCILPPFIIILIIAMLASDVKDNPAIMRMFQGIRPVSVAIIAGYTVKLCKWNKGKWWAWLISGATLILVAILKVSPIYILSALIIGAAVLPYLRGRRIWK